MYRFQQGFALRNNLIAIAVILALLAIIASTLPKGYSDDVSQIGNGNNIALLIHDKNTVTSLDIMALMDEIRDDYAGIVDFMVVSVDVATPQERAFVQQQKVRNAAVLLFSPEGERLDVLWSVPDVDALRTSLNETFQLKQ